MAKYVKTEQGYINMPSFAPAQFKPEGKSYLTFSSPKNFTLEVNNKTKNWDGILEYFAYDKTWTVWDGTTTLSAVFDDGEYFLYLRGTGNKKITGLTNGQKYKWVLTGSEIACTGNIENLLDYGIVESGGHPTMASYCYNSMFYGCTALTQAPDLPAKTLIGACYSSMFYGCSSLTQAPDLPATTLKSDCYQSMFEGCTALTQAPALPATTLANYCYQLMFEGCTALTQAPALPATTLANNCYSSMFSGCTSLTKAPALPATTLADYCYRNMFYGCTALTQAPALPATTLANYCYESMFYGCTSLTKAPALPAKTLIGACYSSMFYGCSSLTQAPELPATSLVTLVTNCYDKMFYGCRSIKLSSTQTGEYTQEYIVGYTSNYAYLMFHGTGGTFTGTPVKDTYYLSTDNMIVRDTEVATLNGYVGSMIDVASIQPDWNQNDETAPDYVKNRPFYTGNPVETVLVEESTVTFDKNGGLYMAQFPSTFEATVGETYKVYWDGTAYECTCVPFNGERAIGNLSIVSAGSDTGEPFIIGIRNGMAIQIVTADPSASHTFSISGFVSEVVKIDKKYLPDTVATKSEVEAAQTTAMNAQTTANAAQTTANAAQTTANAALPKTGGTMSGNLTIDTENDSFQTIISPGGMALQYVPSAGDVNDELVISGWGTPRIVAREGSDSGFKLSDMGLSLGCTSTTKDGIHLRHSNGSSSPGEIVIQHTNLNNHAKERISIASTGEIECNNRLKFNCGSEIEVVQPHGKTGGSAIILHSFTPNSTKKFKITVDDSGVPTITDESDSTNTWKPTNLPTVTSSDSGKFLRVSDTGEWVAETILSATVSNNTLIIR